MAVIFRPGSLIIIAMMCVLLLAYSADRIYEATHPKASCVPSVSATVNYSPTPCGTVGTPPPGADIELGGTSGVDAPFGAPNPGGGTAQPMTGKNCVNDVNLAGCP